MLNIVKQTLQKELTHFFSLFSDKNITKSAFSQSRLKLKPKAFIELSDLLVDEVYKDKTIKRWKGFRLLAIDGTTLNLPSSQEIVATFGYATNQPECIIPMARASSFYDLLNGFIIDTKIAHYNTSEHAFVPFHLEKSKKNDLIIFDRGYEAVWIFYYLLTKGVNFVTRLQTKFISETNSFWKSKKNSKLIEINRCPEKSLKCLKLLGIEFKPFKLRLVKFTLDNGEVEVLATSLLDEKEYPTKIFKDLYFKRWGIETNYDHLKNTIAIENFTGLSAMSIEQDFYANMFIMNLQTLIARDAQQELDKEKKGAKYEYKINKNLSLGFMKDKVMQIFMSNSPKYIEELKTLFKLEPVPIRKDRKFPREYHRSRRKYHMNKKKAI